MKKKMLFVVFIVVLAGVALVACTPGGGSAVEEAAMQPTAAASGETKTLFVGPELAECTGVAPMECMQIRESQDAPYTYFYDQIEGFTFEPGYEYELLVNVTKLENVPADASSLKYTLVEMVSKTPAAAATTSKSDVIEGTRWLMESLVSSDGSLVAAAAGSEVTAEFKDGQVGGNSSCNSYSGPYTLAGDSLSFGPLASTMMACVDEALMAQESQFLAALGSTARYAIIDGKLELYDAAGNTVLVFVAGQSAALSGTMWTAISVNNGKEAVTSVVAGTEVTIEFGPDGSLSGHAGCNRYNADYTIDGESITIGQPGATRMFCEGAGIMDQEAAYLLMLPQAATYSLAGDKLELRTADGALIAQYQAGLAAAPDGVVSVTLFEGPEWLMINYLNAAGETVQAVDGSEATATFLDGAVSGRASCNSYGGNYTLDGNNLSISETFSTMMACDAPLMDQEQAFLANLAAAASYQITDNTLEIINADGQIVLTFVTK